MRRPFPKSTFTELNPFLLFDELVLVNVDILPTKGVPAYPYWTFDTAGYILIMNSIVREIGR